MIRLLPLLLLAACGIDGRPVPPSQVAPPSQVDPEDRTPGPSVIISGTAKAGVARRF